MTVMGDEVEIFFLKQAVSYSGHHLGVISVGQYGHEDADRHGPPISQGSGEETGLVVEFERRFADTLPGRFRNGAPRNLVQNNRYRRGIEIEVCRERLQTDGSGRLVIVACTLAHCAAVTSIKAISVDTNLIAQRLSRQGFV